MVKQIISCDICGKEFNESDIKDRELYYNIYEIRTEDRYTYQCFENDKETFETKYDICPCCHNKIAKTIEELKKNKEI